MSSYHPYKPGESSRIPASAKNKASKRIRGEIACAECRRLKIKCDRTIPCSTCVKRGCDALCPNGTIPPGESGRFVLAATHHLEIELKKLEDRRNALEDALTIAYRLESDSIHPLLREDRINRDDSEQPEDSIIKEEEQDNETKPSPVDFNTMGTLYVCRGGAARFFGPSGGSESLLLRSNEEQASSNLPELDLSYLPPEIVNCCNRFPFTSNIPSETIQGSIESFLPPVERAIHLCESFLEHLSWMFRIVSRQELIDKLIPAVYKQNDDSYGPHQLSLMLIVLGIGALIDPEMEPYNLEAQHYYMLARAALVLQSVLTEASMVTVKTIHLFSIFNGMSGEESNMENSYAMHNLAAQICTRIGLHLDPSTWNFHGRELYERRVYFWNLVPAILWQSLVTGRPPALLFNFIDCKIPTEEEESMYQQGEVTIGFGIWGFHASVQCLFPIVEATLSAKPPPYESILELDAKIRRFANPPPDSHTSDSTPDSMRRFVRRHYQHLMLLYLHRAFFLQAMTEHPDNPLLSPYNKSVTAAYQSACFILDDTREQYREKPMVVSRVWRIWSFAFASAVVVGTAAMRAVHLNLQPPPLDTLSSACDVFRKAASTNSRAAKALPILETILRKALEAHRNYVSRTRPLRENEREKEEMSIIVGKPTIIYSQEKQKDSHPTGSNPSLPTSHSQTRLQLPKSTLLQPFDPSLATPNGLSTPPVIQTQTQTLSPSSCSSNPSHSPPYPPSNSSRSPTYPHQFAAPSSSTQPHTYSPPDFDMTQFSHADLAAGWETLFHEASGPVYKLDYHDQSYGYDIQPPATTPYPSASQHRQSHYHIPDNPSVHSSDLNQYAVSDRWAEYMSFSYDFIAGPHSNGPGPGSR